MSKTETKEKVLDEIFRKLDLKPLIDSAIIQALTDEAKENLVKGIMSYLSSSTSSYTHETQLQASFNNSIHTVVNEQMKKMLTGDPGFVAEINRCVAEATKQFMELDKEKLISDLANTMTRAFAKEY